MSPHIKQADEFVTCDEMERYQWPHFREYCVAIGVSPVKGTEWRLLWVCWKTAIEVERTELDNRRLY